MSAQRRRRAWSDAELLDLRIQWESRGDTKAVTFDREMADKLRLHPESISKKRREMGLKAPRRNQT